MPDGLIESAQISGVEGRNKAASPSVPMPTMGALWSVDVADLRSPELRCLHEYWQTKRGKRMFPARGDIDPLDFALVLGHVSLVQVEGHPARFRYRLIGSNTSQHLGGHLTGRYTDDLPDEGMRAMVEALYRGTVTLRRPLANRGETVYAGERWVWETLSMPLASKPAVIDMLLIGEICHSAK
jgi:hypothetical protein